MKKVKLNLIGLDGNVFSLMGAFQKQALHEKWSQEEINSVLEKCMSGDYDNLIATLVEHCEAECDYDNYDNEIYEEEYN
jgi:sugar diacid utilization regulator